MDGKPASVVLLELPSRSVLAPMVTFLPEGYRDVAALPVRCSRNPAPARYAVTGAHGDPAPIHDGSGVLGGGSPPRQFWYQWCIDLPGSGQWFRSHRGAGQSAGMSRRAPLPRYRFVNWGTGGAIPRRSPLQQPVFPAWQVSALADRYICSGNQCLVFSGIWPNPPYPVAGPGRS